MSTPRPKTVETLDGPTSLRIAGARARRPLYRGGDVVSGKYRLVRLLGEGGMGSVWLATNLTLEADVALKLIRRGMATDETAARLLREARAAARIEHPSIVRVFDFGATEAGDPFIVMELLRGESLAELLERAGRLPAGQAVRIALPLAGALAAAHDKGIVHRDLKPENVLMCRSDGALTIPKIVDFGIAVLERDPNGRRTVDGMVMGSPEYMSPEQACGERIDGRSDIWSLAVVLYELVCGQRPFTGGDYEAQMRAVLRDPPPPIERSICDRRLASILERAFAKNPDERWQTMRGFGVALAEWAMSQGIGTDVAAGELRELWLGEARPPASTTPPLDESGLVLVPPAVRRARQREDEAARGQERERANRAVPRRRPSALRTALVMLLVLAALAGGAMLHDALAPRLRALQAINAAMTTAPTPAAAEPPPVVDPPPLPKPATAPAASPARAGPRSSPLPKPPAAKKRAR